MRPGHFRLLDDVSIRAFGQLVRQWAIEPRSRPSNDIESFREQLESRNINFEIDGDITEVAFHERENKVLSVLLPLKERVQSVEEQWIACDKKYHLPLEYKNISIDQDGVVWWNEIEGFEEFDNFRIGDYCSSQCA